MGAGPEGQEHAEERPGGDLRELVHLPDRVPLPDDWHPRLPRGGGDSDRLLHFGRDLQVSGWPDDLPDHHLQVPGRDEAWQVSGSVLMHGMLQYWSQTFFVSKRP